MSAVRQQRQFPRLRARSFLATVLEPVPPTGEWLAALDELSRRSPGFFEGRAVILDASNAATSAGDVRRLVEELRRIGVRPMGVEGVDASWLGDDLPPPVTGGRQAAAAPEPAARPADRRRPVPSLVVEQPVRSGQSIVFAHGDVTVLGSVASGAEIVAAGSIHVYGALRGRALAGSVGNPGARLFCRRFEAELIAIDGIYRPAEELDQGLVGRPVQAWLDGDALRTAVMD